MTDLANGGKINQAEGRLTLFTDLDEDWQMAARLIIAWLGFERNREGALRLRDQIAKSNPSTPPLPLLMNRLAAALGSPREFAFEAQPAQQLDVARELVKRVSGQEFNRELLAAVNSSLITVSELGAQAEMIAQRGYAADLDAPILVNTARVYRSEGTALIDEYIDAHAGYNYVEYRNRSLWIVLHAVLRHHPDQNWVKDRLQRILVAALTGGGMDFREILPVTAALLHERSIKRNGRDALNHWESLAKSAAADLQSRRGADDSWGNHKRRFTGLMELCQLVLADNASATRLLNETLSLPGGFAGFQAPAFLRLADGIRTCNMTAGGLLDSTLEHAMNSAHHIQDFHFCARVTARSNALKRWHAAVLSGKALNETIRRFAASPADGEFAADHFIHEPYIYRDDNDPDTLPVAAARNAETLEQLVEVFQRPAVEFRRLNPQFGLTQKVSEATWIRVPDPGFAPLLAIHLGARALADDSLEDGRGELLRLLVPISANNPTALDTVLSYLLIASQLNDPEILEEITRQVSIVDFAIAPPSAAQIGPDPVIPA